MKNIGYIKVTVIALALFTACVSAVKYGSGNREPASYAGGHEVPPGLNGQDLHDFYHLGEGAEVYPYEWLKVLKSANFKVKNGKYSSDEDAVIGAPFLASMDWKFGLVKAPMESNPYPLEYVGLTAAWSNHPPDRSDVRASEMNEKSRVVDGGIRSIKMVGTNCALCHTGEIRYKDDTIGYDRSFRIDGAPNMVNVRGFFQDMAQSTFAVLVKKDVMTQFLKDLDVGDPEIQAEKLTRQFQVELGQETSWFGWKHTDFYNFWVSAKTTLLFAKVMGNRKRLFDGDNSISRALERLLRVTYGFGPKGKDNIGDLEQRMKYFGKLMVGTNPKSKETPSGFARTDAFGRIGNLVLRGENPIDYTAPVSLPWMWGLKYQAMLHYTANTNSVILRNVGQSLGLGAQILNPKTGDSTVNIHNLDRLERLIHHIKVPNWREVFGKNPPKPLQIDEIRANTGQIVYEKNCAECHTAQRRVGPANALYEYRVIPLEHIGTDKYAAENCSKPIEDALGKELIFQDTILTATKDLKERYYKKYNVTPADEARLEFRDLRGQEFFRDTLYGYTKEKEFRNNYGDLPAKGTPGYKRWGYQARHLAGVWATPPYLHNGSVPDMVELLKPAKKRARIFNVRSRDFNPETLGFEFNRNTKWVGLRYEPCGPKEDACFDTGLPGNSNTGHEYGVDLSPEDKRALIEYMKILPPEPEYSWN